jgi:hypothetical protein
MSVSKRFFDIVKQTVGSVNMADVDHETEIEKEASLKMAHAKKKWILDYQSERDKKNQYVKQHVLA